MDKTDRRFKAANACTGGACVEVARSAAEVLVRDGKNRDGAVLSFGQEAWMSFLDAIKLGPNASEVGH